MGIPFFIVFALSIAFLSLGVTGWAGFVSVTWNEFIFRTDLQFSEDLDQQRIPERLQQAFENKGIPLSDNLTALVKDKRSKWVIADEDNMQTYPIKRKKDGLNVYNGSIPHLGLEVEANSLAILQCFLGFLLFFVSLYLMGFFLYLEERESGRIMKNVKSFVKLREFLERHEKESLQKEDSGP